MLPRGRRKWWALLAAALLLVPLVADATNTDFGSPDSLALNDRGSASLVAAVRQGLSDAAAFGDSASARLASNFEPQVREGVAVADSLGARLAADVQQRLGEAVAVGDTLAVTLLAESHFSPGETVGVADGLTARLAAGILRPFSDTATIADGVVATLVAELHESPAEAVGLADQVSARLAAATSRTFADTASVADRMAVTLMAALRPSPGETVGVGDGVVARLLATFQGPLSEAVGVADRVGTRLVQAIQLPLADSAHVGDLLSSTLTAAYRPLAVEALAISDGVSTVKISVSGVPNSQITTDSSGDTIIAGTDPSGGLVAQVSLPPGTVMGASVGFTYATDGSDSIAQATGFAVPYPPGKVVTILNGPGVSAVCVVDSPAGATLQTKVCGQTNVANSEVILPCDGSTRTFSPFPSGPPSRTYTCTRTSQGGQNYLRVAGLAFSTTIVDGTPPTLALPSDVTTVLAGPFGSPVAFSVSATDPLDPSPAVACSARSGQLFPVGTTTVACTARDAAGSEATGSFSVSVVYAFGGFLPPLQGGAGGTFHIGTVIPVGFQLSDARGRSVSFASATITAGHVIGSFRFQGGHYEFALDTRGMAAGLLTITATLDDGTTHSTQVVLTSSYLTSLDLECSPSTMPVGGSTRCHATVEAMGGPPPTGVVAFASSDSRGTFGQVTCQAGRLEGTLTCSVQYSSSSPGEQTITAAYPGDAHDLPSFGAIVLKVVLLRTDVSLTCDPAAAQPGKPTQCDAVVTSQDGSTPTGRVAFASSDPHGAFATVACSQQGGRHGRPGSLVCDVSYTPSSGGPRTITATYSGDASHQTSSGTLYLRGGRP